MKIFVRTYRSNVVIKIEQLSHFIPLDYCNNCSNIAVCEDLNDNLDVNSEFMTEDIQVRRNLTEICYTV
jgi:hypothetical protein